ncbi:MAG: hypothetical protein DIZ78_09370 [endosymbiont of Escarpia spicata]|uniref:Phage tail protein n=1 Tax=endosymbiont of Escarpia spicata TaxID=2200908 RepID=A0A370DN74_9GAMM|nr:MAG: hypothetical protein DIZ78_09370 [endosymbiont of Escarpia spicata]
MIAVKVDRMVSKAIRRKLKSVAKNLDRAKVTATNRTLTGLVTYSSKTIRKDINVKAGDFKKKLKIHRARRGSAFGAIDVSGAHFPLAAMGARTLKSGMVTAKPKKRGGRVRYKGAFIRNVGSGRHRGVFRRVGRSHLPIKELWGPSMMNAWKYNERDFSRFATDRLSRELVHQIQYYRNK